MSLDDPKILSLPAMAARLRVPSGHLRAAAEAGEVPCVRVGKTFIFSPAAVENALAKRAGGDTIKPAKRRGAAHG